MTNTNTVAVTATSSAADVATAVDLSFDAQRLAQDIRYSFEPRSFITELLQNACRSGASDVRITLDEATRSITVADNGCGMDSLDVLLTNKARSGWSDDVVSRDRPYGIGFLAAVNACERLQVLSRGQRLDIDTQVLHQTRRAWRVADPGAPATGCVVKLIGVKRMSTWGEIAAMTAGFSVPVTVDGRTIERHLASDGPGFEQSPIGLVRLSPIRASSRSVRIFLQGFEIEHKSSGRLAGELANADVVHLDPKLFRGMFPDRTRLVDQGDQISKVFKLLDEMALKRLLLAKSTMTPAEFCTSYFDWACTLRHPEVFNDIDLLPAACVNFLDESPEYTLNGAWWQPHKHSTQHVSRADIESGNVVVLTMSEFSGSFDGDALDNLWDELEDGDDAVGLSLADARQSQNELLTLIVGGANKWLFLTRRLHDDHWIHRYVVKPEEVSAQLAVQVLRSMEVNSNRTRFLDGLQVCLCSDIEVTHPLAGQPVKPKVLAAIVDKRLSLCVNANNLKSPDKYDFDSLCNALLAIRGPSSDLDRDTKRLHLDDDAEEVQRIIRILSTTQGTQTQILELLQLGLQQFSGELAGVSSMTVRLEQGRVKLVEDLVTIA